MTTQTALSRAAPVAHRSRSATVAKVLRKPQFWFGLFVLLPILAWYAWFAFGPLLRAFWMAMVQYDLMDPASSPFIGLKNFQLVFSYPLFWVAVQRTVTFSVLVYLGTLPLGVFVSMCLVSVIRGRSIYQFVIYLPVVVSYVAIALLFRMLMDPQTGQFNQILTALGLPTSKWITGPNSALPSIAMIDVWKGLGFHVVIITAGLLGIPEEMYDASKVDGASGMAPFSLCDHSASRQHAAPGIGHLGHGHLAGLHERRGDRLRRRFVFLDQPAGLHRGFHQHALRFCHGVRLRAIRVHSRADYPPDPIPEAGLAILSTIGTRGEY